MIFRWDFQEKEKKPKRAQSSHLLTVPKLVLEAKLEIQATQWNHIINIEDITTDNRIIVGFFQFFNVEKCVIFLISFINPIK